MPRHRTITLKLTRRADGMYCKKIEGQIRYFGIVGSTESEATAELLEFLRARRLGRNEQIPTLTVAEVANEFAAACEARIVAGTMQQRTFDKYDSAIKEFVAAIGRTTLAEAIGADQFADARARWSKSLGPWRLGGNVQAVRTMFKWAFDNRLLSVPPRYGASFSKPTSADLRISAALQRESRGDRKFTFNELPVILKKARAPLKTFVMLALNAGLYSIDIADLRWRDVRQVGKNWLVDTTREKTGIIRRFVLWPECVAALPPRRGHDDLLFETIHGNPWNDRHGTDSIALLFRRLLKRLKIRRDGVSFGALRHTHISAVGDHPDRNAASVVRGHLISGIEKHYDIPSVDRLKSVTDLARDRFNIAGARAAGKPSRVRSRAPRHQSRADSRG